MLTAAFLGVGVSLVSLSYYSAGVWIRPWQADFGWSRASALECHTLPGGMVVEPHTCPPDPPRGGFDPLRSGFDPPGRGI